MEVNFRLGIDSTKLHSRDNTKISKSLKMSSGIEFDPTPSKKVDRKERSIRLIESIIVIDRELRLFSALSFLDLESTSMLSKSQHQVHMIHFLIKLNENSRIIR